MEDLDDEEPMSLPATMIFFSSTTFNGVNSTITQDQYEPWKEVKLVLNEDYIQIVDHEKVRKSCIRKKA